MRDTEDVALRFVTDGAYSVIFWPIWANDLLGKLWIESTTTEITNRAIANGVHAKSKWLIVAGSYGLISGVDIPRL